MKERAVAYVHRVEPQDEYGRPWPHEVRPMRDAGRPNPNRCARCNLAILRDSTKSTDERIDQ